MIIANSISAYHRGLVLNQVNTVGMELVDDMRAAVQNAKVIPPKTMCKKYFNGESETEKANLNACESSDGMRLVTIRIPESILIDGNNERNTDTVTNGVPINGVFCTGNYSYIWNSGYFFDENSSLSDNTDRLLSLKYVASRIEDDSGKIEQIEYPLNDDSPPIRLLKVKDQDRAVCAALREDSSEIDITDFNAVTEPPIDLLSDNSNLALYDLYAPVPATNVMGNNMFYSVSFILGTLQGGANIMQSGSFCVTPGGDDVNGAIEEFDYCSINKFNFAAEAIGGGE